MLGSDGSWMEAWCFFTSCVLTAHAQWVSKRNLQRGITLTKFPDPFFRRPWFFTTEPHFAGVLKYLYIKMSISTSVDWVCDDTVCVCVAAYLQVLHLRSTWDVHDMCLICTLDVPEMHLSIWDAPGYSWYAPEIYLRFPWYVHEMHMRCTWDGPACVVPLVNNTLCVCSCVQHHFVFS